MSVTSRNVPAGTGGSYIVEEHDGEYWILAGPFRNSNDAGHTVETCRRLIEELGDTLAPRRGLYVAHLFTLKRGPLNKYLGLPTYD